MKGKISKYHQKQYSPRIVSVRCKCFRIYCCSSKRRRKNIEIPPKTIFAKDRFSTPPIALPKTVSVSEHTAALLKNEDDVSLRVAHGRRQALLDQAEASKNKEDSEKRTRPGKMLQTELSNKQNFQRSKLIDLLNVRMHSPYVAGVSGVAAKLAAVSSSNALNLLFDMEDYYT
jgi:hypothetical protein